MAHDPSGLESIDLACPLCHQSYLPGEVLIGARFGHTVAGPQGVMAESDPALYLEGHFTCAVKLLGASGALASIRSGTLPS